MTALRFPASHGRAVELKVAERDFDTACVTVFGPDGQPTWAQAGTHLWALDCTARAIRSSPGEFVRWHLAQPAPQPDVCDQCSGTGILWGQTYGTAHVDPVREVTVQCCDLCGVLPDDEQAARAGAFALTSAYRLSPGLEDDDGKAGPDEWVVELPHPLIAFRQEYGDSVLLAHLAEVTPRIDAATQPG